MGPAPLEVLRIAAQRLADAPGKSRRQALEAAARVAGATLDRRFLAADLERLELELTRYQTAFRPEQGERLRALRQTALDAMGILTEFRPRLVGDVLSGTADDYSPVVLQLFAPTPEGVIESLLGRGIPFEESEATYRYGDGRYERVSVFSFHAGDDQIILEVFPEERIREAPLGPGGGALRRASRRQVMTLIGVGRQPEA
ncbi:MAG TPA: hypothetical protein VFC95_05275 [Guyparkeria sp.]|nr:hypothetical protein [Guyparkeria sp.]